MSNKQAPKHRYDAALDGVEELLEAAPSVRTVSRNTDRYPTRIEIVLNERALADAPDVKDVLRAFDARIRDPRVRGTGAATTLALDVTIPQSYTSAGHYSLREHGDSTVITLSQRALDVSGFDLGDTLDLDARTGEIRLTLNGNYQES